MKVKKMMKLVTTLTDLRDRFSAAARAEYGRYDTHMGYYYSGYAEGLERAAALVEDKVKKEMER